jgi:hypothetical protein
MLALVAARSPQVAHGADLGDVLHEFALTQASV